jgi:hypothetical protein
MKRFEYIKAFNSPFKRPKLKWYFGKIAIGTPYFYPRRWVKATPELARNAALEDIKRIEKWNELNKNNCEPRKIPPFEQIYKEKLRYKYAVPKKIGFDFVDLGWKIKWTDTDYRFEWAPLVSFVFFKWQIAVMVTTEEPHHYWEAWLYYNNNTDKTKSQEERIKQCKEGFPLNYTVSDGKTTTKVNYYDKILKKN